MEPIREIDYKARVTELSQAIEEKNLDMVKELCEARADVFEPSLPHKNTPLGFAASLGHIQIMLCLIEMNPDTTNAWGPLSPPPLIVAARGGHIKALAILLNANAEVGLQKAGHTSALGEAIQQKNHDIIQKLLDSGKVNPDEEHFGSITPICHAAELGDTTTLEMLIKAGAKIDPDDPRKTPPLIIAAENYRNAAVKMLIKNGARAGQSDIKFASALGHAIEKRNYDLAKDLIESGLVNLNESHYYQRSPLEHALEKHWKEMIELLLEKGASFDSVTTIKGAVTHFLVRENMLSVLELLFKSIEEGHHIDVEWEFKFSAGITLNNVLHTAKLYNHREVNDLLMTKLPPSTITRLSSQRETLTYRTPKNIPLGGK